MATTTSVSVRLCALTLRITNRTYEVPVSIRRYMLLHET